jgi:hypothetical protein
MGYSIRTFGLLRRYFGFSWLAYRLGYEARRRTGLLAHRTPVGRWQAHPPGSFLTDSSLAGSQAYLDYRRRSAPAFFFSTADRARYRLLFAEWDQSAPSPISAADGIGRGEFLYFAHRVAQPGCPPDWHTNPFTGEKAPADRHWSRVGEFAHGDIKVLWDLSRFGFTYPLVRAYWRTGEERYAETFWRLVEDWRGHNPPQQGPNWRCGQEASFRVMALVFGLYGFADCDATTAERVAALAEILAVSGGRIEANLDYALRQHNNHGISEGMGLWTIGVLFPEFRRSARWQETGRRVLESQGQELIYEDGSFAQHSVVYHRLMLHDMVWALRLGDLLGRPFSPELRRRVETAGEFLYQIQDESTGQAPYYGQNDGTLILPLSNCAYPDYRPVVQAAGYLSKGVRRYGEGPWDEDLLWLFGPAALGAQREPAQRSDLCAAAGGCYTLRSQDGFAFIRCGGYRHRPGQADLLHVDLWWRGQNIAVDAGTFAYNAAPPWDNPLARTIYHNTATVDGRDQMDRAGRFLWLPWVQGKLCCRLRSDDGRLAYWEGEQDGYNRLPSPAWHRRAVLRLADEAWLVLDDLRSAGTHAYRVHWLFPDLQHVWEPTDGKLALDTPAGPYRVSLASESAYGVNSLVRAEESGPRGWRAPFYGHREPALSLDRTVQAESQLFRTLFSPHPCEIRASGPELIIEAADWRVEVQRGTGDAMPLISSVRYSPVFNPQSTVRNPQSETRLEVTACTSC